MALKIKTGLINEADFIKTMETEIEPYLAESEDGKAFQLMRVGYYKKCVDESGKLVLSEIVSLKDNFNK